MLTASTIAPIVDFPLVYYAGLYLSDLSLLDAPRSALPRRPALNGWLVTACDTMPPLQRSFVLKDGYRFK